MSDEKKPDENKSILDQVSPEEQVELVREGIKNGELLYAFARMFREMLCLVILFYIMLAFIRHEPFFNVNITLNGVQSQNEDPE